MLNKFLAIINPQLPKPLSSQLYIGGNAVSEDIKKYQEQGGNILIGTPGRLDDLLKRPNVFHLKEFEVFIMDEADR